MKNKLIDKSSTSKFLALLRYTSSTNVLKNQAKFGKLEKKKKKSKIWLGIQLKKWKSRKYVKFSKTKKPNNYQTKHKKPIFRLFSVNMCVYIKRGVIFEFMIF